MDPGLRRNFGWELFASPMNAAVVNGKYYSKFPQIEKVFGSAGSFLDLVEELKKIEKEGEKEGKKEVADCKIAENAEVFLNPPWTDGWLEKVFCEETMTMLRKRFAVRKMSKSTMITRLRRGRGWR
jgi:hypothetical protein